MLIPCPHCRADVRVGHPHPVRATVCPHCGLPLTEAGPASPQEHEPDATDRNSPNFPFWFEKLTAPERNQSLASRRDHTFLVISLWLVLVSVPVCFVASVWNQDFLLAPIGVAAVALFVNLLRRLLPCCYRCGRRGIRLGRDEKGCRRCRGHAGE